MGKMNLEYFLARRIALGGGGRKNNVMIRIASLSVAISMAVMILSLAVILGFKKEISDKLSGFGSHIQIVNLDGNTSFETVPVSRDQPFLADVAALPGVKGVYPYAVKAGILRGREAMHGIVLKGVGSAYDWTFLQGNLTEGTLPAVSDSVRSKDALISRTVADLMGLGVGDRLEMMFIQDPPRRDLFRVSGIYDTGFGELDRVMVLTDLRNVQRLGGWDSTQVTGFEVAIADFGRLETMTDEVFAAIADNPPRDEHLRVVNVREQNRMIFDWLDAHDLNAAVIITVMLAVALFNMVAALLIILMERTSMIGILKALGMGNRSLQKMFLIRSSFVVLKGMFWGNVAGVGLCLLQRCTGWATLDQGGYFLTTVPVYLDFGFWLSLNLITFVFIVLLMSLPTTVISRILPERSIRFE